MNGQTVQSVQPTQSSNPTGANYTSNGTAGAGTNGYTNSQGQYVAPTSSSPVSSVINASQVATTTPTILPSTPINTSGYSMGVTAGNVVGGAQTSIDTAKNNQQNAPVADDTLAQLHSLIGIEGTKGDFTTQAQNSQDLAGKTQALSDIDSEALSTANSWDEQIKNTQKNFQGSTQGLSETLSLLNRQKNEDLANIGIRQLTAQGKLAAANEIITQKVNAKFSSVEDNIKNLESYYTLKQNDLSDKEKITLQSQIDTQKAALKTVQDTYASTLKNAAQNGAPQSVLQAIDKAAQDPKATGASIVSAAGTYGVDKSAQATADLTRANIAKLNAETAALSDPQHNPKVQQTLEQQGRTLLRSEMSNRSGPLGIQAGKVDQGIHLMALVNQYKQPDGTYNIPSSQYAELAMGLASMISPSGSAESDRQAILSKTASGDIRGAIQYITGQPQNGNTQDIIKNLVDSIERQGTTAESLRDQYVKRLEGEMPTDLAPERKAALLKDELPSFTDSVNGTQAGPQKVDFSQAKITGLTVTTPQGTLTFKDQNSLNQFKKDNNL